MKKLLFMFVAMLMSVSTFATSSYEINDEAVDGMFASAKEASIMSLASSDFTAAPEGLNTQAQMHGDSPVVAFILCWVLGGLAIHRYYMGVDGAWYMFALYACVPIAGSVASIGDCIVLLIRLINGGGVDDYINNKKWFVWL